MIEKLSGKTDWNPHNLFYNKLSEIIDVVNRLDKAEREKDTISITHKPFSATKDLLDHYLADVGKQERIKALKEARDIMTNTNSITDVEAIDRLIEGCQ